MNVPQLGCILCPIRVLHFQPGTIKRMTTQYNLHAPVSREGCNTTVLQPMSFGKTHWGTTVTHAARINYSFTKLLIRPSFRNVFIINCRFCGSAA